MTPVTHLSTAAIEAEIPLYTTAEKGWKTHLQGYVHARTEKKAAEGGKEAC